MIRNLLVTAATSALLCGAAFAQSAMQNDQAQFGDVFGAMTVGVGHADDAASSAVTGGNVATMSAKNHSAAIDSAQSTHGAARAASTLSFGRVNGVAASAAYGFGNGFTASAERGDLTVNANQNADNGADVSADSHLTGHLNGPGAVATTGATAAVNAANIAADRGDVTADITQKSTANTDARASGGVTACCGSASAGAVASANNIATSGTTSTLIADTRQASAGDHVNARASLAISHGASVVVAAATANGNAATFVNAWGYVQTNVAQTNASAIDATAVVTGDAWGAASSSAYGVGNTVSTTNIGSDTRASYDQDNSGGVRAEATLTGSGGVGVATSTAIGNASNAFLCTTCGAGDLHGANRQSNSGGIDAVGTLSMPTASSAVGAANAFGNAATFQVGPGG